jgi:putative sporulation protein YyaC
LTSKTILDSKDRNCCFSLVNLLYNILKDLINSNRPLIFLCIGTDRSTGDSLGPIIGSKLKALLRNKINLYGTLQDPVHAKNLLETLDDINNTFKNPYIIAIDASLGSIQNIGKVVVSDAPLRPGAAMNKKLPPVGNISITGIVNISGYIEFTILQNTRLFTVMTLADIISSSIFQSFVRYQKDVKKFNEESDNNIAQSI